MKNKIISIVVGVIAGVLFVSLGEMISHQFHPVPEGLDFGNREEVEKFVDSLPVSALWGLVLIWGLSSFVGGLITGKLVKENWQTATLITGALLLTGSIINMFMIPHPVWMIVVTVLMYLPAAYLGGLLVNNKG